MHERVSVCGVARKRLVTRKRGSNMRKYRRGAFSLIELVIVIVILAVISAIALPRISRGAKGAGESALGQDLAVFRNAIELYAAEHGGDFPGVKADGAGGAANSFASFESQLTKYSDVFGAVTDTKDATHKFGPYLHKIPPLPVGINQGAATVKVGNVAATVDVASGDGWVFDTRTGQVIANADDLEEAGVRTYDEW